MKTSVRVLPCEIAVLIAVGVLTTGHAESTCINTPANGVASINYVVAGQTYSYQAFGCVEVNSSGNAYADPDGNVSANSSCSGPTQTSIADGSFPCPGRTAYQLVGKIGDICVPLGSSGTFTAPATGWLGLYCNDSNMGDNSGTWSVCIARVDPACSNAPPQDWISATDGLWHDTNNWSLTVLPTNTQSVFLTNALTKTVTIDATTSSSHPDSMAICTLTLSGGDQSTNTLLLDNAGMAVPLSVMGELTADSNGVLRIINSALEATNGAAFIGHDGFGQVFVSDGWVEVNVLYLGFTTNSQGTLAMDGGTLTATSLQGNSNAVVGFSAGAIHTAGSCLRTPLIAGNGTNPATLHLLGGSHIFSAGLTISSNAALTGCGTISGSVVNQGAILSDCASGTLTFSSVVTNNGTIIATNGAALSFGTLVVNNGTIDASAGSVWFGGTVVNNGTILPAGPPAAPGNLTAKLAYSGVTYLSWQDNANNETTVFVEGCTNGVAFQSLALLPANSTNYTDRALSTNFWLVAPLFYRVRVVSPIGYSDYSNIATADLWTTTNSWINPGDGLWQDSTNWSLAQSPSILHTLLITNDNAKTVTIDSTTSVGFSNTLTVADVILSAPSGSTNILNLANAGTNVPLRVPHILSIGAGGLLCISNSALSADAVMDGGFIVDGNAVLNSKSLAVATALYCGFDTNATGSILLTGGQYYGGDGQLLLTNLQPSAIGVNGSGQMMVSNGLVQTSAGFFFVGLGAGSQGTVTVAGENPYSAPSSRFVVSPYARLVVGMETGATGVVRIARGGQLLMTNSFIALIGCNGSGELILSNGTGYVDTNITSILGPVEIGGNPGSQGTLTVAGGVNKVQGALFVGASPGATGVVWMTGGQLIATNWTTYVGVWGFGLVTVSNGNWLGDAMIVGSRSNSYGTVNLAGGSVTLLSKLELGNWSNSVGVVQVTDGSLAVTNASSTASLIVGGPAHPVLPSTNCPEPSGCVVSVAGWAGRGVLTQNGGTVTVDRLILTNGANSVYSFNAGTLQTKATTVMDLQTSVVVTYPTNIVSSTIVTNPQTFVVGDGIQPATFHLLGGVHSFVNDLRIRTNASLTGCGTINGNVLVQGTVVADCGGTLTFTGVVTNNATLRAVNGTTLEFYAPVVNNGLIDVINGNTNFHAGVVNHGIILDANGDYDGDGLSNLQEYLAGTDPTNSASALRITSILPEGDDLRITWSAVTNKTYVVQVATNSSDGSYTNAFTDLATVVVPAAPAITETNYLDVGAVTNDWSRFYRIRLATPP